MLSTRQFQQSLLISAHNERARAADLVSLEPWENGLVTWMGALVRIRQIRRANPGLAARSRAPSIAGLADV